ncbi:MAG: VCBS repeat-containing protein [Cyclobacteriaceae bacterium]
MFKLRTAEETGFVFNNEIVESDSLNIITQEYMYNGGAVAIGDFNNDGWSDIFLGGNRVSSKLFINKGNLRFEDVSSKSGLDGTSQWRSGVALADVNADGLLDIYVCSTMSKDSSKRANMLFINLGVSSEGIPMFRDEAAQYGIADNGYSSGAAFFDYDNDNDLDLYVLTNVIEKGIPVSYRAKVNDGSAKNTDRLYRNNGNNTFTNVSKEAGIRYEGYGLGLAIADINQDGWQDVYVGNDYISNDLLYINNGDGTFSNHIDDYIKHQSQFSMGNDVADINNDGLLDIITLDMLPEGNLRRKTVIGGANYITYINNESYGYAHQYVRNMLQLNNGNGTFSEIGQFAGVHQTEWSWSPLFIDVDNDGLKDLLVTNGFPRDITNKDFSNYRGGPAGSLTGPMMLIDSIPIVKVPNRAFKNSNGLQFEDVTEKWGIKIPSFSNGAAFADFDKDGDLDYVVNNINDNAFLFENTLNSTSDKELKKNYVRLDLDGPAANKSGLGTKIHLYFGNGKMQFHDLSLSRGYISSVEDIVHFGIDNNEKVDSIVISWPGGKQQKLIDVKPNQVLHVSYADAIQKKNSDAPRANKLFHTSKELSIAFKYQEADKIDFNIQRTLPHKFSQLGPGISVGDVNNDGLDDFFVGGSVGYYGEIFLQKANNQFVKSKGIHDPLKTKEEEDLGSLFFDADGDNDLDLYVVSGGFEYEPENKNYQDRLYRNGGSGNFKWDEQALPKIATSKSCVRAADFDLDGDLDLFVGGRVIPGKYPLSPKSFLLRNDGGKFSDATMEVSSELYSGGMITDAIWSDFNNDGKVDLITTGEFMAITVYQNDGRKLTRLNSTGLEKYTGWWNSIAAGDFDLDGDVDFIAGNLGLNNLYQVDETKPLSIYAKDIDGNNSVDAILTCFFKSENDGMKEYPVHFWDELNSQSPKFRRKFSYYKQYGKATIDNILNADERKDALVLKANYMSSSYIENLGQGKFKLTNLPLLVQVAPVNGITVDDIDGDGFLDAVLVGNDYGNEVFSGRYDAFTGLILKGDGKGNFAVIRSAKSGFLVDGDAKGLVKLTGTKQDILIATQNRDSLRVFSKDAQIESKVFIPEALDVWADLTYTNGQKQKIEFYYGSGYLSQSTRKIRIPTGLGKMVVYNSKGVARKIL